MVSLITWPFLDNKPNSFHLPAIHVECDCGENLISALKRPVRICVRPSWVTHGLLIWQQIWTPETRCGPWTGCLWLCHKQGCPIKTPLLLEPPPYVPRQWPDLMWFHLFWRRLASALYILKNTLLPSISILCWLYITFESYIYWLRLCMCRNIPSIGVEHQNESTYYLPRK